MARGSQVRSEKIKDERRRQILSAAVTIFAYQGLAAAKISDVAEAAGLSYGLVYHYFPSKEVLYVAIVERALVGAEAAAKTAMEYPGTPWDRLRFLMKQILDGARQHPEYALVITQLYASKSVPEEAQELIQKYGPITSQTITSLIRQGQEAGQMFAGNPEELAAILNCIIQGVVNVIMQGPLEELVYPSVDTVMRFLRP